jgi:hypothetical protein
MEFCPALEKARGDGGGLHFEGGGSNFLFRNPLRRVDGRHPEDSPSSEEGARVMNSPLDPCHP